MTDNDNKNLIWIPKEGNYIEILGHRIDGFDSFEAFCEYLKKYAELEEMVNCLQAEKERYKKYYFQHEYDKWEKEIKAEAYKECIEKIKAESSSCVATNHGIVVAGSRTYTISEVALYKIEKELESKNNNDLDF